ncbi:6-phosphogluconolactonase [Cellulomonas dongxiuzhuiae]|uniref:6-phosphogluconolactonase n=1 Tax=Cellulomonas dongxiuzhuiae TaxID=2819979 RepID=A0ABX8GGM3_9CELL|nr:6-phosphogluconolactonase [Cellulomonas dongxiuzhuiae]MBO3093532.1 6-phosphogluconolactonase [Cellulomonas dongxiuzhuiae]QWC14661.1 6-phosphogluconolactonase [Cellulomonas dongxiuzhuiae]
MTPASLEVLVHPDAEVLAAATAARLLTRLVDLQSHRSPVHVVLTGGTVGIAALRAVAASPVRDAVDWTGVHLWWGDERFLPDGDPDRNETQAREALVDALGDALPAGNVHAIPALSDDVPDGETSARRYAAELRAHAADSGLAPRFDVLLLGMGPDGHVASLFPGRSSLFEASSMVVAEHDSPKPPSERVSLTFPLIRSAREVWVVAAGAEKAPAVARALAGDDVRTTPAAGARGTERTLWLLDLAAAPTVPDGGPDGGIAPAEHTDDDGLRPRTASSAARAWAAVDAYVAPLVDESPAARDVRNAAADAGLPDIAVSAAQGRLLEILARSVGARRVLEIGTLGGYSTWWLAQALPPQGRLVTLELSGAHADVARASLAAAGLQERVELVVGAALTSLDDLVASGAEPFDLVFVDADKEQLAPYVDRAIALSRPGTLIVVDNVVRDGAVVDPEHPDTRVQGVRAFYARVGADDRVDGTVVQTVGEKGYDGFALLRVR